MRFSDLFNIAQPERESWFDPILTIDTPLFLDPFLLYAKEDGAFRGSHEEIIAFFNCVFALVARSRGDTESQMWRKARAQLLLPEVEELCLGYAGTGTRGAGSSAGIANTIAAALWEAVEAGIESLTHFEEIAILREGFGADRISDATANIIRWRLAEYTLDVCREHGVATERRDYRRGKFDVANRRWTPLELALPTNPYTKKPILLAPKSYLRELPTIEPDDFWNYCYSNENELLRAEFSDDIASRVDKATIVRFARRHPGIREDYLEYAERRKPQAYDFVADRRGVVAWYEAARTYYSGHSVSLGFSDASTFASFLETLLELFRHFVEDNAGWRLLWNDNGSSKREESAQLLFLGIVKHACAANDIDISREVEVGRGPVDFKVSQGYRRRALMEVKLARNSKFWNGLERQLPAYQRAEGVDLGFFIVIAYSDQDFKRIGEIQRRVEQLRERSGLDVRPFIVNAARLPPSASKL